MSSMSHTTQVYVLLTCIGIAIAILWSPLRTMMGHLISALLTPAVVGTVTTVVLWIFWMTKKVWQAHARLLKNLLVPRRVLYRSLEDEDQRKL